jgi:hypothetical protein
VTATTHAFLTGVGAGATLMLALFVFLGMREVRLQARAKREATEMQAAPDPEPAPPPQPGMHVYARPFGGGEWVDLGEVKAATIRLQPDDLRVLRDLNRDSYRLADAIAASTFIDSIADEWSRE